MPLNLLLIAITSFETYTIAEFEVGGYSMENFLSIVLKLTVKHPTVAPMTFCFEHQILLANIYGLVAILIFVGATGVFKNR